MHTTPWLDLIVILGGVLLAIIAAILGKKQEFFAMPALFAVIFLFMGVFFLWIDGAGRAANDSRLKTNTVYCVEATSDYTYIIRNLDENKNYFLYDMYHINELHTGNCFEVVGEKFVEVVPQKTVDGKFVGIPAASKSGK